MIVKKILKIKDPTHLFYTAYKNHNNKITPSYRFILIFLEPVF